MRSSTGPRVLYVTRKFPPSVGGMETAAEELYRSLKNETTVDLVAYGGPNKRLPLAYPALFARAVISALKNPPDVIYLQDGLLSPFAAPLKAVTSSPVVATIHGLDLTYQNRLFQRTVVPTMRSIDQFVANSSNTSQIISSHFPSTKVDVVHYGVSDTFYKDIDQVSLRTHFPTLVNAELPDLAQRPILATTGRLVRRKGVEWFVSNVMPELRNSFPDIIYIVPGSGPMREEIEEAIKKQNLKDNVFLLGRVSDEARDILYNISNLFVMPNIKVEGDVEGFGLVATEASSCGTPVIGSDIEGISDAIQDGRTGFKLPSAHAQRWIEVVTHELKSPSLRRQEVRNDTLKLFSWNACARHYLDLFRVAVHRQTQHAEYRG